jgi:hypothetical protein
MREKREERGEKRKMESKRVKNIHMQRGKLKEKSARAG